MKLLKKYFLSVAKHPIWFVFRTVVCIYVLTVVGLQTYFNWSSAGNNEIVNQIIFYFSITSFVIFVVVSYINEKVVRDKITIARLEPNEMGIMLYPNNKAEIYEKPVWGKYPMHVVIFPKKWDWKTEKGNKKEVEIGIKIKINKTVLVLVSMVIKFTFSGPFQLDELRQKLQIDDLSCSNKTSSNVQRLISQKFQEFNNGLSHDLIQGDLINYLNSEVSMQGLTYSIMKRVSFPKNLFTNIEKTEIEVLNPKFRFSKKA